MNSSELHAWGWSPFFSKQLPSTEDLGRVARVITVDGTTIVVAGLFGLRAAVVKGSLRRSGGGREEQPTVGDWVLVRAVDEDVPIIETRLERKGALVRRSPRGDLQTMAANVERVFLTTSVNEDFNLNRLERVLATVFAAGAEPVIVLTKIDTDLAWESRADEVRTRIQGVEVIGVSAMDGRGVAELKTRLPAGMTGVLLGSSGVGKSSLLNALMGADVQVTSEIRIDDDKGRHTTVSRSLFRLPEGGLLIDNPGIRELQLADVEAGVEALFADIAELALRCKFSDCGHGNEPGCAIRAGLADGSLDPLRLDSYRKLQKEAEAAAAKVEQAQASSGRKDRARQIDKDFNQKKKWLKRE